VCGTRSAPVVREPGTTNPYFRNTAKEIESRISVLVELGVALQGSPRASLALAGSVCDSPGFNCRAIASDPTVRANVMSEQGKINNSMAFFKAYPIISVGLGYKF